MNEKERDFMIKATCVNRYRDKLGNIIGYSLVSDGEPIDFTTEDVKDMIKSGFMEADNLVLISDNKLRLSSSTAEFSVPIKAESEGKLNVNPQKNCKVSLWMIIQNIMKFLVRALF